jgi:hypothetical protein
MAKTKYIVDNVANQTISGNVTINGNLNVTGTTSGLATYKALLTQLGSQTGTTLNDFNDGLIIGETYTITDYISDDDFSNIADVTSGGILNIDYVGTATNGSGVFNGLTGTTSGLGSGASFDVYICGTTYNSITVVTSGVDYVVGDTITILGTDLSGSTPTNDITITVTGFNPNQTGCVFIATGEIPTNWSNGSTLVSSGNLVVKVLENNLGYDIEWVTGEIGAGVYLGFNSITGPLYNTFNRNTTFVLGGGNSISFFGLEPNLLETFIGPVSFVNEKDDIIFVAVVDTEIFDTVADNLYYFPVQIQILQDTDTTPIVISGTVETSFPITLTSIALFCNGNFIQSLYGDGTVNDMSELITYLNSLPNTSYLGVYSDPEDGGVLLEMPTNLVNQFCSSGTLTFEVFND